MRTRFGFGVLFLATLMLPGRGEALPAGWSTSPFGAWTVIDDTTNSLQWLSPTNSTNISFDAMVLELANPASAYSGFRHATQAEVQSAYGVGAAQLDQWPSPLFATVGTFQADWGVTGFNNPQAPTVLGFTSTVVSPGSSQNYTPQVIKDGFSFVGRFGVSGNTNRPFAHPTFGHWLVVDATAPEPGTWALLGSGLLALALRSWRRSG